MINIQLFCRVLATLLLSLVFSGFAAIPAFAHHEAMFGPQSSAVLSPGVFFSAQLFDRESGRGGYRHRETTAVFSGGIKPFAKNPLSMALVVPVTSTATSGEPTRYRFEDAVISARYRIDAEPVAKALHMEESSITAIGGIEVPTGNNDHPSMRGPLGGIAAGLFSVEKRPIAALGYLYYHHVGVHDGRQLGGNFFAGTGVAYTPIDDDARGKLFSLQLGLSREKTFADRLNGVNQADSGASGVFLHPGLVFSTNPKLQYFTLVSIPLSQKWNGLDDRQRFRVGAGVIMTLNR